MPLTVDELLEALPEVGLRLWMLDQAEATWHAAVYDPLNPMVHFDANAETPVAALADSLRLAGVNVEDVAPWDE